MTNNMNWRLCGGTFFTLILNARKNLLSKAENYRGEKSGLTEPETLLSLAKVVNPSIDAPLPSESKTIRDNTRKFKACIGSGGAFFRFNDSEALQSFNERVVNNYNEPLSIMSDFIEEFLEVRTCVRKDEYLIKALLEVISADYTIRDNQPFYICEDGLTMTKTEILTTQNICVEPFLLGIWHYTLTVVKDNRVGEDTYNEWCPPKNRAERTYEAAIGENSRRNIQITYCHPQKSDKKTDEAADAKVVDDKTSDNNVDTEAYASADKTDANMTQIINNDNPTFYTFNITGNNNSFINHADIVMTNK